MRGNTFFSCSWIMVSLLTPISLLESLIAVPTRQERQSSPKLPLAVEASGGTEGSNRQWCEQQLEARAVLGSASSRGRWSGVITGPQGFVSPG